MIDRGPVDVVVLAIGAPHFDGSILEELKRQTAKGTIQVLDVMVLFKSDTGECFRLDPDNLSPADQAALKFVNVDSQGLFDDEDAETLWTGMVPGSAVIALAIEHTWAVDLVRVLDASGVQVAFNYRVPAPVVDEAFASLETNS